MEKIEKIENRLEHWQLGVWQHKLPLILLLLFSILIQLSVGLMDINNYDQALKQSVELSEDNFNWNSNQQGGIPVYNEFTKPATWFSKSVIWFWKALLNCRVLFSFLGALGLYLLLSFVGLKPLIALLGGIAYLLVPSWLSMIKLGNMGEFRILAYLPGIVLGMHYLHQRLSLLASGILSLLIGLIFRENLPGYSIYLVFLLTAFLIYGLINFSAEKKWKELLTFTGLFLIAIIAAAGWNLWFYKVNYQLSNLSVQDLFINFKGIYSQAGSLPIKESLSLVIPGIFGSAGATYWGEMTYSLSLNYLGIALILLAVIGAFLSKRKLSLFLGLCTILLIIFSWGINLPGWKLVPIFSKIQAPAIALNFLPVFVIILAALGMEALLKLKHLKSRCIIKFMIVISLLMLVFIGITSLIPDTFFQKGSSGIWASLRAQLFLRGGIQFFMVILLFSGIYLFKSRIPTASNIFVLAIVLIICFDLGFHLVSGLPRAKTFEQTTLTPEQMAEIINKDSDQFRVLPLGDEFTKQRWSRDCQNIGGYSSVSLKRYSEIIEHCLKSEISNRLALNWNIVNMLNVKYLVYDRKIPAENLKYSHYDLDEELILYENETAMPRYWFASAYEVETDKTKILQKLNNPDFDPKYLAILENDQGELVKGLTSARETFRNSNRIEYTTICDTTALLVQSEVYCEVGWKAYLDGEEIEILPVNYILRGVMIPGGEHKLEFRFEIEKLKSQNLYRWIGISWLLIALIAGLVMYVRRNYSGGINYSVRK